MTTKYTIDITKEQLYQYLTRNTIEVLPEVTDFKLTRMGNEYFLDYVGNEDFSMVCFMGVCANRIYLKVDMRVEHKDSQKIIPLSQAELMEKKILKFKEK